MLLGHHHVTQILNTLENLELAWMYNPEALKYATRSKMQLTQNWHINTLGYHLQQDYCCLLDKWKGWRQNDDHHNDGETRINIALPVTWCVLIQWKHIEYWCSNHNDNWAKGISHHMQKNTWSRTKIIAFMVIRREYFQCSDCKLQLDQKLPLNTSYIKYNLNTWLANPIYLFRIFLFQFLRVLLQVA